MAPLIVLPAILAWRAVATSGDWAITDKSGRNTFERSGGNEDDGAGFHVHLELEGQIWDTNLHKVAGAFSSNAMVTLMRGGEIVKNTPARSIETPTYSDEDGNMVFSIVGSDKEPEVDGIVVGKSGVLHVHARAGAELEIGNNGDVLGVCGDSDSRMDGGRRLDVKKWSDCYEGDTVAHAFSIGVAVGSGLFRRKFKNNHEIATKWINSIVTEANVVYKQQLNIALTVGSIIIQEDVDEDGYLRLDAPAWDDPECKLGLSGEQGQLSHFGRWQPPSEQGIWHLFDDCFGSEGGVVGLAGFGSICQAEPHARTGRRQNTGVSWYSDSTWLTFAHEVGHNFGARHSFELGEGATGGIMDYGDGKLKGEYQFNTQFRKTEICDTIQDALCSGTCSALTATSATTAPTNCCRDILGHSSAPKTCYVPAGSSSMECYYDCASLISAADQIKPGHWCSQEESQFKLCQKSCGACSDDVGGNVTRTLSLNANSERPAEATKPKDSSRHLAETTKASETSPWLLLGVALPAFMASMAGLWFGRFEVEVESELLAV